MRHRLVERLLRYQTNAGRSIARKSGHDVVERVIVIGRYGCSVYNHAEFTESNVSIAGKNTQMSSNYDYNIILIMGIKSVAAKR